MRNALKLLAAASLLAVAACSQESDNTPANEAESAIGSTAAANGAAFEDEAAPPSATSEIPVSLPKMTYASDYGFRLPGEDIAALQQKHADMCEALGPTTCQIVNLSTTGDVDEDIGGVLQLAVATDRVRGFGGLLTAAAESAGAETFRANIQGEDLSKSLVDTEARLRSRIALRDRLLEVLETRRGTVEELVEAERGVAAVNEEIDQAQSWLAEQKGRVAFSKVTLNYETATPGGSFFKPVDAALGSLGAIFGNLLAVLIVLTALAVPVLGTVLGVRELRRRLGSGRAEA